MKIHLIEGCDLTQILKITQYIEPEPANLGGEAKGVFPFNQFYNWQIWSNFILALNRLMFVCIWGGWHFRYDFEKENRKENNLLRHYLKLTKIFF